MSNIVEAEYKVIQERTLPVIASEILWIEENACRVALDAAIRIGERLCEAKEIAGHGDWAKWCEENLNYSQRKAERFMKIYSEYGDENSPYLKSTTLSNLSISKALSLLDIPKEDVEEFAEKHDINELSTRQLEEEIRKLKEEKEEAENVAKSANSCIGKLESEIENLKNSGVDPEELRKIEEKFEKEKEKNRNLKERLEAEKEKRQKVVDEALAGEKEKLSEEIQAKADAEVEKIKRENKKLEEKIEKISKRAKKSANENLLVFKIKTEQLQDIYRQCTACIGAESDPETQTKMKNALNVVMDSLRGGA